jgi:hypothetical protein
MIAKSKDKILLLDKAVIPQDAEWDEEKFFYYADTLGFALIDRSNRQADRAFNQYQVLDMRLYEDIQSMIRLLDWIRQQCFDTIGFSQQRLGEIAASETATNATNAAYASAVITEDLFLKHEEFLQRELQGLLDLSRIAYRNGYKSLTYTNDRRLELININPELYSYMDLAIMVSNNSKQKEKLDSLKNLIQPYLQNGGKMSSAIEVLEAENTAKIKHVLREIERKEQEQLERQAQNEQVTKQEHEKEMLALQQEQAQIQALFKEREINLKYDREEQIAYIEGDIKMELENIKLSGDTSGDVNKNNVLDINEVQKRAIDREKIYTDRMEKLTKIDLHKRELDLKEKDMKLKHEQTKMKVEAEKYRADSQVKISKINK